jgi:drug/metabolite transporter (DMT)-like permease
MLAALGAACTSPMAILVTLAHVGPATTVVFRCGLALPALAVVALAERRSRGPRPAASHGYAVLAGFFLAADLVVFNHTIADVGAGPATVIGSLHAPFVAVLAWLVLGERPSRRYLAALPVALLGVALVSGIAGGAGTGSHPAAGVATGIAASAAYAGFQLILRHAAGQARHVAGQVFEATAGAAIGSMLLGWAFGGLRLAMSWQSLGWLLLLALLIQTVGWLFIASSLPRLPATISSLLLLLQPAAAMGLAAVILGQLPTLTQVAGGVLVCCGLVAIARTQPSTPAAVRLSVPIGERGRRYLPGRRSRLPARSSAAPRRRPSTSLPRPTGPSR